MISGPRLDQALLVGRSILPVVVGALPAFLTGALAVQVSSELRFAESGLGIAVASFFFASSLTSVAFGRAVDRFGAATGLRVGSAVSTACMTLIALYARSLWSLALLLALGGLGNSLTQPAANLYLARAVRPGRQGLAFAVKQSSIPAATMLAGLAVPTLALTVGWRWAYAAGATLSALAALLVGRGIEGPPAARRGNRPGSRPGSLVAFAVGIGFGAAAAGSLAAFLVSGAVAAGLGAAAAGLLFSASSLMGMASRVLLGYRADRVGGDQMRVVVAQLAMGAGAVALLALGVPWVIVVAAPVAFATGWGWPGLFNFAIVRANPSAPGRATGTTQTGTYVGAMLGPLAFGAVAERASYAAGWAMAATLLVLGAVSILVARRMQARDPGGETSTTAAGGSQDAPEAADERRG